VQELDMIPLNELELNDEFFNNIRNRITEKKKEVCQALLSHPCRTCEYYVEINKPVELSIDSEKMRVVVNISIPHCQLAYGAPIDMSNRKTTCVMYNVSLGDSTLYSPFLLGGK